MNSHGQTLRILNTFPQSLRELILPLALVKLLVLAHYCDWNAASSHGEDVPDEGVSSCEGDFVVSIVVGGFAAETRAYDHIELVGSPVMDPLLPQTISFSDFF